jgi:hypothetical protein
MVCYIVRGTRKYVVSNQLTLQTHRPFVRRQGKLTAVNVGSSGVPHDVGNLASCTTFVTTMKRGDMLRVKFNARALVKKWDGRIAPASAACQLRTGALGVPLG